MRGSRPARACLLAAATIAACGGKTGGTGSGGRDGGQPDGVGDKPALADDGGGGSAFEAGPEELPPRRDAAPAVPWVWGPVQQDACVADGRRQLSAPLENIPAGTDPAAACAAAPRNLMGIDFARPDRCVAQLGGVRGQWDVPDASCLSS